MDESIFTLYKNEKRWDSSLILRKNILGITIEKVKEHGNVVEVFIESNDAKVKLNVDNLKFLKDTFKSYDEIILNIHQIVEISINEEFNYFKNIIIQADRCYFYSTAENLYNLNIICNTLVLYSNPMELNYCCLNCHNIVIDSKINFCSTYVNNCYSIIDNCRNNHINNDPFKLLRRAECVLSGDTLYKRYYTQSPIDFDDPQFREFKYLSDLYTDNYQNSELESIEHLLYTDNYQNSELESIEHLDEIEHKLIEFADKFCTHDWKSLYYRLKTDGFTTWETVGDYKYRKLTTDEVNEIFVRFS